MKKNRHVVSHIFNCINLNRFMIANLSCVTEVLQSHEKQFWFLPWQIGLPAKDGAPLGRIFDNVTRVEKN